jgi:hypothetical protein
MARQIINVGAVANDGTGDALRFAFTKTNENFAELYNKDGDLTASIAAVANSVPTDVSQLTDTTERIPDRDYNRLFNKPFIPSDVSDLTDDEGLLNGGGTSTTLTHLELTNEAIQVTAVLLDDPVSFEKVDYDTSNNAIDFIDEGVAITRGNQGWLYNPFLDLSGHAVDSPNGTRWNGDDTTNLKDYRSRTYETLYDVYGGNFNKIVGKKAIMKDTINDKYYLFEFTAWTEGQEGGGFAYTRSLILGDPGYFEKLDDGDEVDIFVTDDPVGSGIGITRGNNQGIYNSFQELEWDEDVSPAGTLWNIDGWDDLSNITERQYTNFYDAFGRGGLGNKVVGIECVMYIPATQEYYAIKFVTWTPNNQGGGFSYFRYAIDLEQINEGIKFADGTSQKTAYTNVISTASRGRKIVQESGFSTVSITERVETENFTGVVLAPLLSQPWDVLIDGNVYTDLLAYVAANQYQLLTLRINNTFYDVQPYINGISTIVLYNNTGQIIAHSEGDSFELFKFEGGEPVRWIRFTGSNFRGAIVDYHAYFTDSGTKIGTIYVANDSGDYRTNHVGTYSGSDDRLPNLELWYQDSNGSERELYVRRLGAGDIETAKIHWTAKLFYGDEFYD